MKTKHISKLILIIIIVIMIQSCGSERVEPPPFNAERAFEHLTKQVSFGPRVPGSQASADCRTYFYKFFNEFNISIDSQTFVFFDPYSQTNIPMVNVIGSYSSQLTEGNPTIVLMAHYDCRPRTDYATDPKLLDEPIDGASDGASGVAVLLELAQMVSEKHPELNIDFVLVDGEDWGKSGDHVYYMLGSKEFARYGIRGKYKFGIVVDLVGDADLTIYRERLSEQHAKQLNDLVFETAMELNCFGFIDSVKYSVLDDHLSLITAGVPAIDLIDFDYKYWHTEFDTPDKCSPQALESVGRLLSEIIYNKRLWQKIQ